MKQVNYCLAIFLTAFLYGCKSQQIKGNETGVREETVSRNESNTDSLLLSLSKEQKEMIERLSNLKIENTTTYYTLPDSTGKQYPVYVSQTKADKEEKESKESYAHVDAELQRIIEKMDSMNRVIQEVIDKKEETVELSWWDVNNGKIGVSFAFIAVAALLFMYHIKNKKQKEN